MKNHPHPDDDLGPLPNDLAHRQREANIRNAAHETLRYLRGLLIILDSDHIKTAEGMARIHGYELDRETAEQYGAFIKEARKLCGELK